MTTRGELARTLTRQRASRSLMSDIEDSPRKPQVGRICSCQRAMFSGKASDVDLFFPKFLPCTCGQNAMLLPEDEVCKNAGDICLFKILRKWQVDFLSSCKIRTVSKFAKVYKHKRDLLCQALKKWYKHNKNVALTSSTCRTALRIWLATCKTVTKVARDHVKRLSSLHLEKSLYAADPDPLRSQIMTLYSTNSRRMSSLYISDRNGDSIVWNKFHEKLQALRD